MTFGTVICVECAGVHRGIAGNQIRSFFLDTKAWKDKMHIDFLKKIGGNTKANGDVWENHLPHFYICPHRDSLEKINDKEKSAKLRSLFIKNKYEKQSFIPLSQREYFSSKNHCIAKVPIDPPKQCVAYIFNLNDKEKWNKKPNFICLHSNYFSIYANNKIKRSKCEHIKTLNLISCKCTINNIDPYDDDDFFYEFQIVHDSNYKSAETESKTQSDEEEILLRVRIKDFDNFTKYVHEIRKTISYYRMYSALIDISQISVYPSLELEYNDFLKGKNTFIGFGKLFGGQTSHFYVSNGKLYTFRDDPLSQIKDSKQQSTKITAKHAWDLQKIDVFQDVNGDRSGFKFSIILIEPFKLNTIKFENGKIAMGFYLKLYKLWSEIRGNYSVDFKDENAVILEERRAEIPGAPPSLSRPSSVRHSASKSDNRWRSKSSGNALVKPPQILEIMAKMDEEEEEVEESEEIMVGLPPPNVSIDDEDFRQMKEMHKRMSDGPNKANDDMQKKAPKNEMSHMPQIQENENLDIKALNPPISASYHGMSWTKEDKEVMKKEEDFLNNVNMPPRVPNDALSSQPKVGTHADIDSINDIFGPGVDRMSFGVRQSMAEQIISFQAPHQLEHAISNKQKSEKEKLEKLQKNGIEKQQVSSPPIFSQNDVNNDDMQQPAKRGSDSVELFQSKSVHLSDDDPMMNGNFDYGAIIDENDQNNEDKDKWNCPLCTFLNEKDDQKCAICGAVNTNKKKKKSPKKSVNSSHSQSTMHSQQNSANQSIPNKNATSLQLNGQYHGNLQLSDSQMPGNTYLNGQYSGNLQLNINLPVHNAHLSQQYSANVIPPQHTALNSQYSGQQMMPQHNAQYSANNIAMNPQLNMQYSGQQMMQQQNNMNSPLMMMNYHQAEFQKYFQMQQFPQQHNIMNARQLQQVQSMASYHFEQYAMINRQQQALRQRQRHYEQPLKQNKKGKLLKKRKAGIQMQYIKLQRYFVMNKTQKLILSDNINDVQQHLKAYAQIQIVPELDCYELLIPSHIALPQRKAYWQKVLKKTRDSIGMSMEHIMQ